MRIDVLGIDLAKNVFQLHGVDRKGNAVFKRRVMRDQLLSVISGVEHCTIAIEACTGAFYWARQFEELGHKVTHDRRHPGSSFEQFGRPAGERPSMPAGAGKLAPVRYVIKQSRARAGKGGEAETRGPRARLDR